MHVELRKYVPSLSKNGRIQWRYSSKTVKELRMPPTRGRVLEDQGAKWFLVLVEEDINSESFIAHGKQIHKDEIETLVIESKITL